MAGGKTPSVANLAAQGGGPNRRRAAARAGSAGGVFQEFVGRHRLAQQEALQRIAAQAGQEFLLRGGFHALGHDAQVQLLRQRDDRRDDGGVLVVVTYTRL